ncbi:PH domain-containing protein [Salmonirosea aquatica]|uniref:Uncharacterized protein YyaB-like PH domain-containing protein n=1 Tax=Salmonirosea aquatica TaxID=2654236 RepID=A0A7C9FRJ3_9BACT|nr:hypothetical protein [Cytophagaceae bacterium SJW1-29]
MSTIYKSKIGLELVIPLFIILGGATLMTLYTSRWLALLVLLATDAFVIHLFATTFYQIDGNRLRIKSGFLYNETIDIHRIKQIVATNSLLSSPALSLDRLEIKYNTFDSALVSPKEKLKFIENLKQVNPAIHINLKK